MRKYTVELVRTKKSRAFIDIEAETEAEAIVKAEGVAWCMDESLNEDAVSEVEETENEEGSWTYDRATFDTDSDAVCDFEIMMIDGRNVQKYERDYLVGKHEDEQRLAVCEALYKKDPDDETKEDIEQQRRLLNIKPVNTPAVNNATFRMTEE